MAKYDYDSYTIYEMKRRPVYAIKIRVTLTEQVHGDVLSGAAAKAFKRFPYYSRTITLSENAYLLLPSDKPIVVMEGDHVVRLGSEESNGLYFAITYENNEVYFHFAHNFCGACGAMRWLKATLWQYLADLGYDVDKTGIMTVDTPMTLEEAAEPDVPSLPHGEAFGNLVPPMDSYIPMNEYIERMKDPNGVDSYYPITIPKKEFMKYVRDNDGSPNSVISAMLFKMYTKVLPEEKKFTAGITNNYRADVGCPQTYRDILRQMNVQYDVSMKDWPIEKLSTYTRSRMYLLMQPEISWDWARRLDQHRCQVDAQPDIESKVTYAIEHSFMGSVPCAFNISYVGKVEWGGLGPYILGVFTLTVAHLLIEINATEDEFCISFQTYRKDRKYLNKFLEVLDEEGVSYTVGEFKERRIPQIVLP